MTYDSHRNPLAPKRALTWRDVDGELVAIDVETGAYHLFNDVGRTIWLAVAEGRLREAIAEELVRRYRVPSEQAVLDVASFIMDLTHRGLLVACHQQKGAMS